MKKKIFMVLIAVFMFMGYTNTHALDLTQSLIDNACNNTPDTDVGGLVCHIDGGDREVYLLAGTHSLSEDVEADTFKFYSEGGATLNLNNHTITGELVVSENSSIVINGDGTVNGRVAAELGNITINGGTYNNSVVIIYGKLVITNGTINSGSENMAVGIADFAEVTISGGTFNGNMAAVAASKEAGLGNVKSINISGGTFNGGVAGLLLYSDDIDSVNISGGTFTGNESGIAALTEDGTKANTALTDILADGYIYSPTAVSTPTDMGGIYYVTLDQKEVSVVRDTTSSETTPVDQTTSNDTNDTSSTIITNPKTGDNLFIFISLLGLSLLGIGGAGIYIKRKILN